MCLMCGIFGAFGPAAGSMDPGPALNELRERGPDESGSFRASSRGGSPPGSRNNPGESGVILAHSRLKIVGLERGRQPILNEEGDVAMVSNGEIYNYPVLKAELESKGHRFSTDTDIEVAVHGYEEWGTEVFSKLRGMFAIAIYDSRGDGEDRIIMARDRMGIKPLLYALAGDTLVFSSTLPTILLYLGKAPGIDRGALGHYLMFRYVPPPLTILQGIHSLLPGEVARYDTRGGLRKTRYYDIFDQPIKKAKGLDPDLVSRVVEARLMGDVPMGTFLSGGLDSSLITAIAHRRSPDFQSFSLRFEDADDDADSAWKLAEEMGWALSEVTCGPSRLKDLEHLTAKNGMPVGDPAVIPTSVLASHASRKVKFVLTGEGADELFGGYPYYGSIAKDLKAGKFPLPVPRWLSQRVPSKVPFSRAIKGSGMSQPEILISNLGAFDRETLARLCCFESKLTVATRHASKALALDLDPYNRLMVYDISLWLHADLLAKVDTATMVHGLEARVPYLDRGMVAAAMSISGEDKIKGDKVKLPLKKVAERHLPLWVIKRRKHGFDVPMHRWLGENAALVERTVRNNGARKVLAPHLDLDYADSLLAPSKDLSNSHRAWNLYALFVWASWYAGVVQ